MAYTPQALAARLGEPHAEARTITVRDGVAVLPVDGPIFPRSNLFSDISGATSLEILACDLNIALDDPAVTAILLEVDSPGGEVSGVSEFAAMVRAGRERKPIAAYVQDLAASAAYWIAAAASPIVVADTAAVGSIGVVAAVPDPSQRDTSSIEFVSSQSPNKRPDPNSKSGKAYIQAHVDEVADVFVAAVAKYRGITTESVIDNFGQGGLLVGASAVQAGMADQVGSFEQTFSDLVSGKGQVPVTLSIPPAKIPATHPSKPARPARSTAMGFRQRWEQFMSSLDADDESAELSAETPTPPSARPTPQVAVPPSANEAEVIAARQRAAIADQRASASEAELRKLRAERITERATQWADGLLREGRANPSERAACINLHERAATHDANFSHGDSHDSTMVTDLEAAYAARPAHQLTAESLTPALMSVLQGHRETPTQDANREATPDELEKLLKMTAQGQALLSATRGTDTRGHINGRA